VINNTKYSFFLTSSYTKIVKYKYYRLWTIFEYKFYIMTRIKKKGGKNMKKLNFFLILIVCLINQVTNSYSLLEFNKISHSIEKKIDFVENSVKVQYKSKNDNEVLNNLINKIKENYKESLIDIEDDCINIVDKNKKITVETFLYSDCRDIKIEIVNYDKNRSIIKLMKELNKLLDKKDYEIKYYSYIKGKTNNINEADSIVNEDLNLKSIQTLEIHKGKVGTGFLYCGEKISFAINEYDTGSYLIIGTPIINTTY